MAREKIIFIINPVSGSKSKAALPGLIEKGIDKNKFDYQIVFTDYSGQATEITSQAIADGVQIVVAVGGDGTVNEIGKTLINTAASLAILPAGSGNGLARHMKIPLDIKKAIAVINKGQKKIIDAGSVNDRVFFCTSGVGFDAHIGEIFAKKIHRGFKGYVAATIKEFFKYEPETYRIFINGKVKEIKAFLVTFANASQYGNNAYIAPHALIHDNLLDICIMKKFPFPAAALLGIKLFTGKINQSPYVDYMKSHELTLKRTSAGVIHLDGEPVEMGSELKVKVLPSCLSIVAP